jgi:hypothetical protein
MRRMPLAPLPPQDTVGQLLLFGLRIPLVVAAQSTTTLVPPQHLPDGNLGSVLFAELTIRSPIPKLPHDAAIVVADVALCIELGVDGKVGR